MMNEVGFVWNEGRCVGRMRKGVWNQIQRQRQGETELMSPGENAWLHAVIVADLDAKFNHFDSIVGLVMRTGIGA